MIAMVPSGSGRLKSAASGSIARRRGGHALALPPASLEWQSAAVLRKQSLTLLVPGTWSSRGRSAVLLQQPPPALLGLNPRRSRSRALRRWAAQEVLERWSGRALA